MYTESGAPWLPAPLYYWKVVHNEVTNEAIAFVGLNDAHEASPPQELFCENQCDKLEWVDWSLESLASGFMYCCDVQELRSVILNIPDLSNESGAWPQLMVTPEPEAEFIPPGTCIIDKETITAANPPMLIKDGAILYQDRRNEATGHNSIYLMDGDEFTAFCHCTQYKPCTLEYSGLPVSLGLTCYNGTIVDATENVDVDMNALTCSGLLEPTIVLHDNVACATEGIDGRAISAGYLAESSIGWDFDGQFHEQIRLCQDVKTYATLWTRHVLHGANIDFRDIGADRPDFRRDVRYYPEKRFFPFLTTESQLSDVYKKSHELAQVELIYGQNLEPKSGLPLVEDSSSGTLYFARGHLSPDAAFVTQLEQDATYYFSNVAPQYQRCNNGNWKALEGAIRDYAKAKARDVVVYTGTYGTLNFYGADNRKKRLYLERPPGKSKMFQPPLYYWKVLHDQVENKAVAFVGYNNPFLQSKPNHVCSNVCDEIEWVDWDITSLDSGYMICCRVEDLKTTVDYVPDLAAENGNVWPDLIN